MEDSPVKSREALENEAYFNGQIGKLEERPFPNQASQALMAARYQNNVGTPNDLFKAESNDNGNNSGYKSGYNANALSQDNGSVHYLAEGPSEIDENSILRFFNAFFLAKKAGVLPILHVIVAGLHNEGRTRFKNYFDPTKPGFAEAQAFLAKHGITLQSKPLPLTSPNTLQDFEITLIKNGASPIKFTVHQLTDWPDHGEPKLSDNDKRRLFVINQEVARKGQGLVIHCAAGIGRTCTLELAFNHQKFVGQNGMRNLDKAKQALDTIRAHRPSGIQEPEQFNSAMELAKDFHKLSLTLNEGSTMEPRPQQQQQQQQQPPAPPQSPPQQPTTTTQYWTEYWRAFNAELSKKEHKDRDAWIQAHMVAGNIKDVNRGIISKINDIAHETNKNLPNDRYFTEYKATFKYWYERTPSEINDEYNRLFPQSAAASASTVGYNAGSEDEEEVHGGIPVAGNTAAGAGASAPDVSGAGAGARPTDRTPLLSGGSQPSQQQRSASHSAAGARSDASGPKAGLSRNKKIAIGVGAVVGTGALLAGGSIYFCLETSLGNKVCGKKSESTPIPSPTPPVPPVKNKFGQMTDTVSSYNRTFSIVNEGTADQNITTLSFLTNTPFFTNSVDPRFGLTTVQLPNGLYQNTFNATEEVVVKAGETIELIDFTATPSDQSINGNFPTAITVNAYNVTATIDGEQLMLAEAGATPPVNQTYPIGVSFTRDQDTLQPSNIQGLPNKAITGVRLDSIVIQPGTGLLYSTWIPEENKRWSILQTVAGQSGTDVTWGLVGDCSGNPNEITWTNFLSTPSLRNTIAQNIGNALQTYADPALFNGVAIDTVGCNLVATDLLSFMQAVRSNVGTTPVSLVTPATGPDASIVAGLKAANINLVINTAGSTPAAVTATITSLIAAGYDAKAISLSIPAGDPNADAYATVIKTADLKGVEVQNGLSTNATATVDTLNTALNSGVVYPAKRNSMQTHGLLNGGASSNAVVNNPVVNNNFALGK